MTASPAREPRRPARSEASDVRTVRLCLLGFGHVAQALCRLLGAQERVLRERHGLRVLVTAAGTRRGCLVDPAGLTPAEVLARAGHGPALPQAPLPARDLLAASDADVLVELTVMGDLSAATNAVPYRPEATAHVLEAFRLGMDVVTANKGPIAWSWPEVSQAAAAAGRRIRCESAVVDGLPVFSLLEFALPDCRVLGFEAVFNATTNFIVDAMGAGRSFEDALAQTQADGYAEADPTDDVNGADAAAKMAILGSIAFHSRVTLSDVAFEGIQDVPIVRTSSLVAMLQSGSKQEETSEFSLGGSPQGRPADHLSRRVTDIAVKGVKRGRARRGLSCPNEVTVCAHRREADGTMCLVNVLVAKTRQSAKRWPSPRSWA